jgi:hypothetical protein
MELDARSRQGGGHCVTQGIVCENDREEHCVLDHDAQGVSLRGEGID